MILILRQCLVPFLFLLSFSFSSAQTITVTDAETRQPLEHVSIICKSTPAIIFTDENGKARIAQFSGCDSIIIQQFGYQKQVYSLRTLTELNYNVSLSSSGTSLDEVVVSAVRWEQEKRDVSHRITGIKPRDIYLHNPQTAADMLQNTGEVYVQKSQLGGGSPMIRGFAANRVLIVVDGIRMNNAIFRSGNLQNVINVDPFILSGAEVIFGPGSVMYGSDAIGGVMNFRTLEPQLSSGADALINGSGSLRYSSANQEKTAHAHFSLGYKKWAFVSSVTRSDFDDLRMGKNGPSAYKRPEYVSQIDGRDTVLQNSDPLVQKPTGYSQLNLMQKIRFWPNYKWDIVYSVLYSTTSNFSRYDRLSEYRDNKLRFAEWYYGPQKWLLNSLQVNHNDSTKLYDALRLTLAWQQFEESRHDRRFNSTNRTSQIDKVNAHTANLDASKTITKKQHLYYGAEAVFNKVNSEGRVLDIQTNAQIPAASRYPDNSTYSSLAAYTSYLIRMGKRTTLQAGIRYSHTFIEADFDTTFLPLPFQSASLSTGALNGNIGITYRPTEKWQLNAQIATGFRAPNIDDIGKIFESAPGALVVPNPNLKPEYARSLEASIIRVFGRNLKAEITGYYTYLDNALIRRDYQLNGQDSVLFAGELSQVQAIQNSAYGYIYGLQTSLQIKLPHGFGFSANYNYQRGKEEDEAGNVSSLRHAAPAFGLLRITWNHKKLTAEINAQLNGEISNSRLALSEQDKPQIYAPDTNGLPYSPAWQTFNFKSVYRLTDYLEVSAGVENITDQRYRTYSSGITAPGRNLVVSARAMF